MSSTIEAYKTDLVGLGGQHEGLIQELKDLAYKHEGLMQ
jgi:hypothetical protein